MNIHQFLHGWTRSKAGNQYKRFDDGLTITIFAEVKANFGRYYKFCVSDGEGEPFFGDMTHSSIRDAQLSAWDYLTYHHDYGN
jgi:hypothetical protein